MPKLVRALFFLLSCIALLSVPLPSAAQVSRQTLNQVSQLILKSYNLLTAENDTAAARAACEKALAIQKAAGDPFIAATVDVCFGDVADYEGKDEEACRRYDAALKDFAKVPAKHPARRTLDTHINVTKGKRLQLGC